MVRPITTITALLILTLSSPAQGPQKDDFVGYRGNPKQPKHAWYVSPLVVKSGYVIAEDAAGVRRQGQPNPLLLRIR